jgi:hypothetical protein
LENDLYDRLALICNFDQSKTNTFVDGEILTCPLGRRAIAALERKTPIAKVPLDQRGYCRSQLVESLKRPGRVQRLDILCTVAHPGSGKTIIQNFNAFWFKNETKGIAVVTTFDDDQRRLFRSGRISTCEEFQQSLAVRILHRVVQHFTDDSTANIVFEDAGHIVQTIVALDQPLESSLTLLRRCFGAPADTKVLLCIDEIAKVNTDTKKHIRTNELLRSVTGEFDIDPTFFISVTAVDALDMAKFFAVYGRRVLLQPTSPLWFESGLNSEAIASLPPVLQPFYNEDIRVKMPIVLSALDVYDDACSLLLHAAGQGARLQTLMKLLCEFPSEFPVPSESSTREDCEAFTKALGKWLREDMGSKTRLEYFKDEINEQAKFPRRLDFTGDALESFVRDTAESFSMPHTEDGVRQHQSTLIGITENYCQLVTLQDAEILRSLIPYPVLNAHISDPTPGPLAQALLMLRDSINAMHKHKYREKEKLGKDWEAAVLSSFLLFARSNTQFSFSEVCDFRMSGSDVKNVKVYGGETVELWKYDGLSHNSTTFPSDQHTGAIIAADVQVLVERLHKSGALGAFIWPLNEANRPGDFYAIFRTVVTWPKKGHILVRFQVKDVETGDIVQSWRKYDDVCQSPITLEDGSEVPVLSLLFSSNELQQPVVVGPSEGVVTITGMRNWLPTAAHALQTFTHLRKVFLFENKSELVNK